MNMQPESPAHGRIKRCGVTRDAISYPWITRPSAASAASCMLSAIVG